MMLVCQWALMTVSRGKQGWADMSAQHTATARTIHKVEPYVRPFHSSGAQRFQHPLLEGKGFPTAWQMSAPCVFNAVCNASRLH
jgi:hypothetical protein